MRVPDRVENAPKTHPAAEGTMVSEQDSTNSQRRRPPLLMPLDDCTNRVTVSMGTFSGTTTSGGTPPLKWTPGKCTLKATIAPKLVIRVVILILLVRLVTVVAVLDYLFAATQQLCLRGRRSRRDIRRLYGRPECTLPPCSATRVCFPLPEQQRDAPAERCPVKEKRLRLCRKPR